MITVPNVESGFNTKDKSIALNLNSELWHVYFKSGYKYGTDSMGEYNTKARSTFFTVLSNPNIH